MAPVPFSDRLRTATLTDRPFVARPYPGAWLVLSVALLFGLGSYYVKPEIGIFAWEIGTTESGGYMGVNYHVYHVAAEHALAGESFYGIAPDPAAQSYTYLYPPVSVFVFAPFTLVDWTTGYMLMTACSVLGGVTGALVTVRYVESMGHRLGWIDVGLVSSLFVLSIHVAATIYFGNINILLGLAFVVGFWALASERSWLAGAAFAVPALFKVFPALIGLWLLRRRRFAATGVAIATGIGGILAGVALFGPDLTVQYVTEVISGRSASEMFVGGYPPDSPLYVTVQRPLSHLIWALWPGAPYVLLPTLSVVLCASVLAYFYREITAQRSRLIGAFVTVICTLVVVPSFRLYAPLLFVPFVALLYTWQGRKWDRRLFLAGALLFSVPARPRHIVDAAAHLPGVLGDAVAAVGTVATVQLYAYAVMVLACALSVRNS